MKRRFSEEQIIGLLKEAEAGRKVADLDLYVGLSAGSMLAVSLAGGITPDEMVKVLKAVRSEARACSPWPRCDWTTPSRSRLSALTVMSTRGIEAAAKTLSVLVNRRSRVDAPSRRECTALARSIRWGKSMSQSCGGTYGHLVMKQRSQR